MRRASLLPCLCASATATLSFCRLLSVTACSGAGGIPEERKAHATKHLVGSCARATAHANCRPLAGGAREDAKARLRLGTCLTGIPWYHT
eukprot:scaffold5986_cov128-Isochrysis_galbana.AAC.2